jgi:GxxExxY protein
MSVLYEKAMSLTGVVIGGAIEVHKALGPGLIESVYEWCFVKELELLKLRVGAQKQVQIVYKGFIKEESLRFDLLVEDCLLVEVKAVESILPIHKAQLLSYMKMLNIPVGLLINFNQVKLVDGVHRLFLPGANQKI